MTLDQVKTLPKTMTDDLMELHDVKTIEKLAYELRNDSGFAVFDSWLLYIGIIGHTSSIWVAAVSCRRIDLTESILKLG